MQWPTPESKAPLTPASTFLLAFLFVLVMESLVLSLRLQQPWTGVQLKIERDGLIVEHIANNSPLAGQLQLGERLLSLASASDTIPLPKLLLVQPLSIASYSEIDTLLDLQARLEQAFRSNTLLTLTLTNGNNVYFTPKQQTDLADIPALYWWLLIANTIGLLLGVVVWTYKPHSLEAICLLIASITHFIAESVFRLSSSKEFYLPPNLTEWLTVIEGANFYLFMGSLLAIMCYYPNRIAHRWVLPLSFSLLILLALGYGLRWWELPIHTFMLPIIPFILYGTWLFYRQWILSAGNPVSRTTVFMLQLSVLLPTWMIMLVHAFPVMLGIAPLFSDVVTRLLLIAIFAGWAIGILRFRLFDIEYWWLKSLLWIVGGSLVLVLDIVLVSVFHTSGTYALGLSVMLAGFLYFPLRQWLIDKLLPSEHQPLQTFLPAFSQGMANATSLAGFEQRWRENLQQRLRPLHWENLPELTSEIKLSDNGIQLLIPSLSGTVTYKLIGKQMASRLFNTVDVKNTAALLTIARMASQASEARQQAIFEERQRIMRDLHDSVGSKLLTLTYKLTKPEEKEVAKQALMTLRDTIRLALKPCPLRLEDQLADWRAEITERAEASGVQLRWEQQGSLDNYPFTPQLALELTQLLREAVSNALKHASPEHLIIGFKAQSTDLEISITNDGAVSNPALWKAGTGLNTMASRVKKLAGTLEFSLTTSSTPHNQVRMNIPFHPAFTQHKLRH